MAWYLHNKHVCTYAMRQFNLRSTENYLRYLFIMRLCIGIDSIRLRENRSNCTIEHILEYWKCTGIASAPLCSFNLHIQLHEIEENATPNRKFIKQNPKNYKLTERYWALRNSEWARVHSSHTIFKMKMCTTVYSSTGVHWKPHRTLGEANWHTKRIRADTWNSKQIASHKWIIVLWF